MTDRPADPFALGDGKVVDAGHVHRTARGDDLVRSKSEVIVADALHDLGLDYRYEAALAFSGELPRHPDFTIERTGAPPVYWEHLGMLDLAGYRAAWKARKAWYASHDIRGRMAVAPPERSSHPTRTSAPPVSTRERCASSPGRSSPELHAD